MILSTDSIPHGRYEGILASLMLYGTYREGLRSVTWSAVGRGNIGQDTDIDATAVDKAVLFWSHFSSIPTAVNDWVWNLPDSELRQWSSKLVSLDIRWLQSLDAGETSRPLLSEPEIHEIATRISESLSPLSHSIAISENASRFLNEHSFLTELLKERKKYCEVSSQGSRYGWNIALIQSFRTMKNSHYTCKRIRRWRRLW